MDGGDEKKTKNEFLVVILVVLVVVIIGLVVGIVLMNLTERNSNDDLNVENKTDCIERQTRYDISVCIEEVYKANNKIDQMITLYREAIDTARTKGDYDLASELVVERSNFLNNEDYCNEALQLIEDEDISGYDLNSINRIYIRAIGLSTECGDDSVQTKWENKLKEVNTR